MNLRSNKIAVDERDITKICYLYYKEGKTQKEISSIFGMSRFKIIRLLKEARKRGLVTIQINDPLEKLTATEVRLAKQFDLRESVVVRIKEFSDKSALEQIGEAGAQYLGKVINSHKILGVSWGWTVSHVVKNVEPVEFSDLRVVQISGGLGTIEGTDTNMLTMMLSQGFGGTAHVIQAPVIVKNQGIRDTLLRERKIKEALALAKKADIVILGIGMNSKAGGLWRAGFLGNRDHINLKRAGAVGAICGRFYNINGEKCLNGLDDRIIGLTLDELRRIKHKIGIAIGAEKLDAILGALRGQLIDVLITDEETAENLLSQ
jgi:DNA-binding transcriptional regulator LsrR (DeoR family)